MKNSIPSLLGDTWSADVWLLRATFTSFEISATLEIICSSLIGSPSGCSVNMMCEQAKRKSIDTVNVKREYVQPCIVSAVYRMQTKYGAISSEYKSSLSRFTRVGLVLGACWCLTIVPGCIHFFLPDGGAGVIAGLDLSQRGETIVAMFAWMGAQQIPQGIAYVTVGLRYRSFTPFFLLLHILERGLMTFDAWFGKGSVSGHHPPEHYASVVAVSLGVVFFTLAMGNSRQRTE